MRTRFGKTVCFLFLVIFAVSCSQGDVIDKQIAAYESAIDKISAVNTLKELSSMRKDVRNEIEEIRISNYDEYKKIMYDSKAKKQYAIEKVKRLKDTRSRYIDLCKQKKTTLNTK